MVKDNEKFRELIKGKKIPTIEEMLQMSSEYVKNIPDFEEKYKKILYARGCVLEPSTTLEIAFNELILKTGGENFVIDQEKKELRLITGIKKENELGSLSFTKKARIVKEIMEKVLDKPEEIPKPNLLDDFERFTTIRDIFAHVPINWSASELEFNDKPPYKHFFKLDPSWKKVSIALNEFMNIQKGILEVIPRYIRLILLNKKLMSTMLFGTGPSNVSKNKKR